MFFGCLPCCGGPWGCPLPASGILEIDMEWQASISGVVTDDVTRGIYEIPEESATNNYTSYLVVLPGMTGDFSEILVRVSTFDVVIFLRTYQGPLTAARPYQLQVTFQYSPCSANFLQMRRRTFSGRQSKSTTFTNRQASHSGIVWQHYSSALDFYRLQLGDVDDGSFSGESDIIPVTNSWAATTTALDDTVYSLSASLAIYDIYVDGRSVFRPAFYREGF